ncbi:MOSC domain-containing protein [Paucibacter sp. TC2R-5]|uniref:MOSC domain-containing protein n=1 Tax=Paucibacter sp. TC2R-5 TaxID=2893555 RepID=UPI0021E4DEA2|nr:MOSC domain-containing protein [Paucibacter sp. TC2R-5]MCV2360367.1 MOSC domain-containing protein [Paucibacter sp. TC2R-5]
MDEARASAGAGLQGDKYANPLSPRQLLIASSLTYRDLRLQAALLRENLLIDFPTQELSSGSLLQIGRTLVLWITFQCEPCKLLERRQPGLVKALGGRRGVLARVLRSGTVRVGDPVSLRASAIPAMSDAWQDRVVQVLQHVPQGQVIDYSLLADLAGVAKSYCRAFPRALARHCPELAQRAQSGKVVSPEQRWGGVELFDKRAYLADLPDLWPDA